MGFVIDRRELLAGTAAATVASPDGKDGGRRLRVGDLRVAQLEAPFGLGDPTPSLAWRIDCSRRGARQVAYRIRTASSRRILVAGGSDIWDSGRVESDASLGVAWGGRLLRSRDRVWWTVTAWDEAGASATADPAWFEMGLLERSDWTGRWIAAEEPVDRADRAAGMPMVVAPSPRGRDEARLFRLPFSTGIDGDSVVTLITSGFFRNVTVDGRPVDVPHHPYDAYGPPPAFRVTVGLQAGNHMVAGEVTPPRTAGPVPPPKEVSVAGQVRSPAPAGTVWTTQGWRTADSAPEGWRMPGSSETGWSAAAMKADQPHPAWPAGPAVLLRRRFLLDSEPAEARLYVACLGGYEMRLNGRKVGDHLLEGETSDFRRTILTRTYNVTGQIVSGANAIAAMVGDGWYASYAAPTGRYAFGPAPRRILIALEMRFADGSRRVIASDGDWRLAPAPVRMAEIYNGETYDARFEQSGWDAPGFDDRGWLSCWMAEEPAGTLAPHAVPPVRVTREIAPRSIRDVDGVSIVDFGQNFAGLARLKVRGTAGQSVRLRFGELLTAEGRVDQRNLRAARQTDLYILRGDPEGETYQPRFTYHGFRYVEVAAEPGEWSIRGLVTSSDLPETGTLRIADPMLQRLWLNSLWSQRSNFVAIPTDCPQRDERLGWTADAQVFWDTAAYNMDVGAFTRRFLRDMRDGKGATGAFPIFAPISVPVNGATPGWGDAGIMMPYVAWRRYGDLRPVAEHWPAMARHVASVIADNPGLIWTTVHGPDFSDWLAVDTSTLKPLIATAMLKRSVDQLAEMSEAIGKGAEAADLRVLAGRIAAAFRFAFVKADGIVGSGSQTSQIAAIKLGLLTASQTKAAGTKLVADIRARGTSLTTGFLGTPLSLDVLADLGETTLVYDLLLRTAFPSWGYMVAKGATTIWERWNGDTGDLAMNSYNHYALGAVCGFLFRRIAGIEETAPGFATFRVKPLIDPRVPSGGATYNSARGPIRTAWAQRGATFTLDLDVPANTRAEVHLPHSAKAASEGGRPVTAHPGLTVRTDPLGSPVMDVGCGHYHFEASMPASFASRESRIGSPRRRESLAIQPGEKPLKLY